MTTEHEPLGSQIAREFEELGNIKRIKINEVDPRPKSDDNQISKNWFIDKNKELVFLF